MALDESANSHHTTNEFGLRQILGWILGPVAILLPLIIEPPDGLSALGWRTAGAALFMAIWWITEAVPIPITALTPIVIFPALRLGDVVGVAAPYANPLVFLFLGGFLIALAMQRWDLHRRVAIGLIGALGTKPTRIIAGFMLSGAVLSMWVSNTATTLMMLPIATSVVALLPAARDGAKNPFGPALMLAVAYGATTGGMATLIGTPPNALLAGFLQRVYGYEIGFAQWMLIGLPVTIIALPVVYLVLTRVAFRLGHEEVPGMNALLDEERAKLGPFNRPQAIVAIVFACTALAWILRPLLAKKIPMISDTSIAIAGAVALFMIPSGRQRGEFLMDWKATRGLPWDVLLLFGGGLSLASVIKEHGLSDYLGTLCGGLGGLPTVLTVAVVCFGILLLTELTSNTGTAATFLPVVAAVAISVGENPLLFLVPTALAANCSYMMPVGTPPNAIVFGSGLLRLPQMARTGILLNILLVPILLSVVWLLGRLVFDIQPSTLPDWAK